MRLECVIKTYKFIHNLPTLMATTENHLIVRYVNIVYREKKKSKYVNGNAYTSTHVSPYRWVPFTLLAFPTTVVFAPFPSHALDGLLLVITSGSIND